MHAEGGIAIAVRMLLQILQVQQLQRDAGAPQFGVNPGRIRQRARRPAGDLRPVEPLFQRVVAQPRRARPTSSPIAVARLMTDATAPGLIPRLRAVSRWLRFKRHFSRRISRMCRMGSRSVAITLPAEPRSPKRRW